MDAYTTLRANLRAGNLGKPARNSRQPAASSPRRVRRPMLVLAVRRADRLHLDHRRTTQERPLRLLPDALKTLREYRKGESDLIERDGVFYLIAVCEVPEAEQYEPGQFIGVDLGIANIATTSTGYRAAGRGLNRHGKRQLDLRKKLQAKGTKSAPGDKLETGAATKRGTPLTSTTSSRNRS